MFSKVKNEKLKKSIIEAKNMINGNNDENLTDITDSNSPKNEKKDILLKIKKYFIFISKLIER